MGGFASKVSVTLIILGLVGSLNLGLFGQKYRDELKKKEYCRKYNTICLNFFILDGSGTNLADGAKYRDPEAPIGEPSPTVKKILDRVVALLNGLWDQCCVELKLGLGSVVRPEKIKAGSKTLEDIFTRRRNEFGEEEKVVKYEEKKEGRQTNQARVLNLLENGLRDIRKALEENGKKPGDKCLNIFIVGTVEGAAGFARTPGKVAVFGMSWYVDPWDPKRTPRLVGEAQAVRGLAHEIGHNLGLHHPGEMKESPCKRECQNDRLNLMWKEARNRIPIEREKNPGSNLLKCQCNIVEATKAKLGLRTAMFHGSQDLKLGSLGVVRPDVVAPAFWGYISRGREAEPVTVVALALGIFGPLVQVNGGIGGVAFRLVSPGTVFPNEDGTVWRATEPPPGLKLHEGAGVLAGIPGEPGTWFPAIEGYDAETGVTLAYLKLLLTVEEAEKPEPLPLPTEEPREPEGPVPPEEDHRS